MILPIVLYDRLGVLENRVLRIYGPTMEELVGGWRKLHNEEHHNSLFTRYQGTQIKENKMGWACSIYGRGEKCIQNLTGKHGELDSSGSE
jgi:hypothetical protein